MSCVFVCVSVCVVYVHYGGLLYWGIYFACVSWIYSLRYRDQLWFEIEEKKLCIGLSC